jgi:hypothetical protein
MLTAGANKEQRQKLETDAMFQRARKAEQDFRAQVEANLRKMAKPSTPQGDVLFQSADPRRLFKDGGDLPILPPGGYEQLAGRMDASKIMEDGWNAELRPILDAMKESANSPEQVRSFAGLDAQTNKELNGYLNTVASKQATVKHSAMKWGEANAEYGLLNYDRQYGFDKVFSGVVPYEFYATRTMMNWFARVADRPAFISQYVRFMNLRNTYENQLPERTRGKMWLPLPGLPQWAGDGAWIDPTYQMIPFKQFLQPFQAYTRDQQNLSNNAIYVLRDWADSGEITPEEATQAMSTQSGQAWERAIRQAQADQGENASTGSDYFSMLFGPALYLTLPYYLATGKKLAGMNSSWPSGQLPVTRVGAGLETALQGSSLEWLGDAAGALMAGPERWTRKQLGLSEFGEWGQYYIDRQMSNMAAEGIYDVKDVQEAMITQGGPIYDEAVQRVRYELMLKIPGMAPIYNAAHGATLDKVVGALLPSLYPAGLLPVGEMEQRNLKQEYSLAWEAKKNGNDQAINDFFDKHPEYSARLALRKDPQERLTQFLKSEIWDAYGTLGTTNKKEAAAELGPDFKQFLQGNPEDTWTTEQLAQWAQALNARVPATPQTQKVIDNPAQPVRQYDQNVTRITDEFFRQRTQQFPNYYEVQQGYYALPTSDRAKYLLAHPDLKKYWDWKDSWYRYYPQYKPIFNGDAFDRVDTSTWPPALEQYVSMYAMTGERLPNGAYRALEQVWIREGRPYDNMQTWLDSVVAPAMLYGN